MDEGQLKELRELVEFLKANGIAEFDMERPDLKVRLKFAGAAGSAEMSAAGLQQLSQLLAAGGAPAAGSAAQSVPAAAADGVSTTPAMVAEVLHEVKSPIVGTFYESPSPGTPPFVKIGDQVEAGQVLCIVEAMKLMNEVEADVSGEIVERIAASGQPVEYGQPLFSIRAR